ncbi:hypothetical protein [Streptomyces sp. JV180]|uniref:hypothetical protein n=1 Tax=Streptomyces sp. JV180 TaxID=858634 RepID=UPI00168B826F|nr:hypothetical protein [Streptomyces sp. JV180]MBD3550000.1 hypothetical protein [Streptomyces sp. JV180]
MASQITELQLNDGTIFRVGDHAPHGTIRTIKAADVAVIVRGIEDLGSRIEVRLNKGYSLQFPGSRLARLVLQNA